MDETGWEPLSSRKQCAAPTFKGGLGYHPILVFLDNTREALAGILRPGNAGSNTAAHHLTVIDAALAQIPDEHRHGAPILVRADSAGCTQAFLTHLRGLRVSFSVGFAIDAHVRTAIRHLPAEAWTPAIEIDSEIRDGAWVAELTGLLDLAGYPAGTRVMVRRERPHPGAQLSLFDHEEGFRHLAFATDIPPGRAGRSRFWKPATEFTPEWKTASAPARTPGSAGSRPGCSRSTRSGWNSR
jgi:hypothetical protein